VSLKWLCTVLLCIGLWTQFSSYHSVHQAVDACCAPLLSASAVGPCNIIIVGGDVMVDAGSKGKRNGP